MYIHMHTGEIISRLVRVAIAVISTTITVRHMEKYFRSCYTVIAQPPEPATEIQCTQVVVYGQAIFHR